MKYHLPISAYKRRTVLDDITVHCADTFAHQDIDIADVRKWHTQERGWIDTGYHAFIKRNGILQIGRPWWAEGAGVAGWNHNSFHVCLAGGKGKQGGEENNFTEAQFLSLRNLIVLLREVDPGAERVIGHREFPGVTKYCPSFDVQAWLKSVGLERVV